MLPENGQAGALKKQLTQFLEDCFDATPLAAEAAAHSILLLLGIPSPECAEEVSGSVV